MKNKYGKYLIAGGVLLIVAALFWTGYNLWDESRALKEATALAEQLRSEIGEPADAGTPTENEQVVEEDAPAPVEIPAYVMNPEMEMPLKTIAEYDYIGILEIPSLNLVLPVISDWSYPALKVSPCRYMGSPYEGNFIIAAHNYQSHFGFIKNLKAEDMVMFTDMEGNVFQYKVVLQEILEGTAVEEMENSDFDLTLFTCTIGGQNRVTVRCEEVKTQNF